VELPYAYPDLSIRGNLDAIRRLRRVVDVKALPHLAVSEGKGLWINQTEKGLKFRKLFLK
jgi:hypothetical protein